MKPFIAVVYDGELNTENVFLLNSEQENVLKVFDADISNGLQCGRGKRELDYIQGWNKLSQEVRWKVKVMESAEFEMKV